MDSFDTEILYYVYRNMCPNNIEFEYMEITRDTYPCTGYDEPTDEMCKECWRLTRERWFEKDNNK